MAKSQCSTVVSVASLLAFLLVLTAIGCNPAQPPVSPDTRAAEEANIRKLDADWVRAAQTKQVDAWLVFYADDAVVLPPNDKAASGKESIRKPVADLLGLPELSISWQPNKVEVARSGDLAYLYGTYDLSFKGPGGKIVSDTGKNLEIWKKQSDGSWKCIVDTWNSDLPATPAQ
jgi:uncharacterized protein (TIGR02246 family)